MTSQGAALDFYRAYGPHTDPGEYANLFAGVPDALPDLCAFIKTQLIHPAEVARYADVLPEGRTREDADVYSVHDMLRLLSSGIPRAWSGSASRPSDWCSRVGTTLCSWPRC